MTTFNAVILSVTTHSQALKRRTQRNRLIKSNSQSVGLLDASGDASRAYH